MITNILQLQAPARKALHYLADKHKAANTEAGKAANATARATAAEISAMTQVSISHARRMLETLVATKQATTEVSQTIKAIRYYQITQHGLDIVNNCVAVPKQEEKKEVEYYTAPAWEPARSDALKFLEIPSRSPFSKE
jgi:hypothetical protein